MGKNVNDLQEVLDLLHDDCLGYQSTMKSNKFVKCYVVDGIAQSNEERRKR